MPALAHHACASVPAHRLRYDLPAIEHVVLSCQRRLDEACHHDNRTGQRLWKYTTTRRASGRWRGLPAKGVRRRLTITVWKPAYSPSLGAPSANSSGMSPGCSASRRSCLASHPLRPPIGLQSTRTPRRDARTSCIIRPANHYAAYE